MPLQRPRLSAAWRGACRYGVASYLIVNSTAHACVEMLVEVMVAVQVAPPLAVYDLFHEGTLMPPEVYPFT